MATKSRGFGPKLVQSLDQTKKEADSLRICLSLYGIIAVRRRIDWLSLRIGDGRIEHIARLQRLAEREWIPCIHSIVAKKPVESSVGLICARLGDDIKRPAARSAQLRRIVAAVDLKFLNGILTDRQPDAAGVVVRFAAVHSDAVASSIAAVERESAVRRLLDPEICVESQSRGIGDAGALAE